LSAFAALRFEKRIWFEGSLAITHHLPRWLAAHASCRECGSDPCNLVPWDQLVIHLLENSDRIPILAVLVCHVWFGHALRSSGWDRECHNSTIIGGERSLPLLAPYFDYHRAVESSKNVDNLQSNSRKRTSVRTCVGSIIA